MQKEYDDTTGLDLEVSGCDVDFVPGDLPTIRYAALFKQARGEWHTPSGSKRF